MQFASDYIRLQIDDNRSVEVDPPRTPPVHRRNFRSFFYIIIELAIGGSSYGTLANPGHIYVRQRNAQEH
jgi:hypothetical protein